jgi:hypothetical protein
MNQFQTQINIYVFYMQNLIELKDIVSKLTVKFWMCQKCGKMKDYNQKMTTNSVEWLHDNYKINLAISF